ncbi:hypothetical protein [Brunnivagina elsteri]|uniref:hypothetical protein n=1 Tax=Brunnivagina elsteri TaxID=1247191 RepID=UPI0011785C4F|nr:hypothetical protein [Calothrix elsteri]
MAQCHFLYAIALAKLFYFNIFTNLSKCWYGKKKELAEKINDIRDRITRETFKSYIILMKIYPL